MADCSGHFPLLLQEGVFSCIHSHLNHRDDAGPVMVVNEAQNKTQRRGLRHGWGMGISIRAQPTGKRDHCKGKISGSMYK